MKKKIAVLAGICMLVSVQGTVFAADRNSPDDLSDQTVQSVIRADVPDSHKITVKGEHVTVSLEGGNQEENSILVERFSEPKLKFSPEKGWKIKKVLLGDTDVTSQVKDGIITLASVYEDLILTVETEKSKTNPAQKQIPNQTQAPVRKQIKTVKIIRQAQQMEQKQLQIQAVQQRWDRESKQQ